MTERTISLSADLDRTNVASLARESAEVLASGVDVLRFDGSAVARVRLSAVQMLASAARSAALAGVPFELLTPSSELMGAIRLCGLTDLILSAEGGDVQ